MEKGGRGKEGIDGERKGMGHTGTSFSPLKALCCSVFVNSR